VYTNEPPAGALRGFGISQVVWAYESQADVIARALNLDPIEFRRRNILREGRPHATGMPMTDIDIDAILDRLAERMEWNRPFDRGSATIRRGRGIAIGIKSCVAPTTSVAMVNIYGDGSCGICCSTIDMGQGSDTAMAQIAGEILGVPAESIRVVHPDTDVTPTDMPTLACRCPAHMANAVLPAAEYPIKPDIVERQLIGAGTMQFGFTVFEEMIFNEGQVVNASFADYKIPGMLDLPEELTGELVEVPHRQGPFGAKGVGETGMFCVSPAIGNALYDAVEVRVTEIPLTPERVLRALRQAQNRPLGSD